MNERLQVNVAKLVGEFVQLRDGDKEFKEHYEKIRRERFLDRMEEIQNELLDFLNKSGAKNIKTQFGTAIKQQNVAVHIQDGALFRDHVINGRHWDLLDWRANKTSVKNLVEDHKPVPPGLNYVPRYVINVRKPS